MRHTTLICCTISLIVTACGDANNNADQSKTDTIDNVAADTTAIPIHPVEWTGINARWKKDEGAPIGGLYDTNLLSFKPCNQNRAYPTPRERIEITKTPNCDNIDDGSKIPVFMKVDSSRSGESRLVQVDTVVNGKAVIVRDGRSDSVQISPKAIERIKEFRRVEGIKKRKAEELKRSQEQ